jgi:hypothetical protein
MLFHCFEDLKGLQTLRKSLFRRKVRVWLLVVLHSLAFGAMREDYTADLTEAKCIRMTMP